MVAGFFAAVSAGRPRDAAAEERVLAAVRQHATPLDQQEAEAAGRPEVTAGEVEEAVRRARPGTAPGPDGVPVEVWRRGGEALWGLLAALYSAIGRTARTPAGFLNGVVSPIYTAGDATAMATYRPI